MINSTTFLPIDTSIVIDEATRELDRLGIKYELHGRIATVSQHKVELLLPDFTYNDGTSDMTAKLYLSNANNGTRAFRIAIGFLRLVCSNGLVVGQSYFNERIVHRNTEKTKQRVSELPTKIQYAIECIARGDIMQPVFDMQEIELTDEQAISVIGSLPVSDSTKSLSIRTWLADKNTYVQRREADRANTAWSLYNITNEAMRRIHGSNTLVYNNGNEKLMDEVLFLSSNELKGVA